MQGLGLQWPGEASKSDRRCGTPGAVTLSRFAGLGRGSGTLSRQIQFYSRCPPPRSSPCPSPFFPVIFLHLVNLRRLPGFEHIL